jgi:restriction system protein
MHEMEPRKFEELVAAYGVTVNEKATTGLIVTTSSFTKDAKSFQDQNKYRVQLADQADLQAWLRNHRRK